MRLLEWNANVHIANKKGRTAFHPDFYGKGKNKNVLLLLLRHLSKQLFPHWADEDQSRLDSEAARQENLINLQNSTSFRNAFDTQET